MSTLVNIRLGFDRFLTNVVAGNRVVALLAGLVILALLAALALPLAASANLFTAVDVAAPTPASLADNPELSLSRHWMAPVGVAGESALLADNPELIIHRRYLAPSRLGDGALNQCCSWELQPRT